jgi:hypothetical protein
MGIVFLYELLWDLPSIQMLGSVGLEGNILSAVDVYFSFDTYLLHLLLHHPNFMKYQIDLICSVCSNMLFIDSQPKKQKIIIFATDLDTIYQQFWHTCGQMFP